MNPKDDIERRDSGPSDRSSPGEVLDVHWRLAVEKMTQDILAIADWMCAAADDKREWTETWQYISTSELVGMAFGGALDGDQAVSVLAELRARYIAAMKDEIQAEAEEMANDE